MNKFIGIGNLARDPEIRTTASGKIVTSFSIGIQDGYGENKTTTWMNIVAWEKIGESAGNNLTKGSKCLVEGRIQNRSYEGKDGVKRFITEVIAQHIEFLSPKKQNEQITDAGHFGHDVAPDDDSDQIPF